MSARGRVAVRNKVVMLVLCLVVALVAQAAETVAPDALLERGLASYRSGRYSDATVDLDSAAKTLLSQEQMQTYVSTGKFPSLDKLETALVYLALAQSKLGHDDQSRDAVLRLLTAERIEARYAQLPLNPDDAAQFERIVSRVAPGTNLRAGVVAAMPPPPAAAAPAPIVAQAPPLTPAPAPKPPAPVAQAVAAPPPVQSQADRDRMIEEALNRERARLQREADERLAAERSAIQRQADERVAAVAREAEARIAAILTMNRRSYIVTLRQADEFALKGQPARANDIYNALATGADVPREIVAEAGVGLYRTGAYRDAAAVFRKLAPFARGEEDLRYYNAVSLFETGSFAEARHELACALPFVEMSDDVNRYRMKIEAAR